MTTKRVKEADVALFISLSDIIKRLEKDPGGLIPAHFLSTGLFFLFFYSSGSLLK